MLHAWITTNYYWITDEATIRHAIVDYDTDAELTEMVADAYRDIGRELGVYTGEIQPEKCGAARVKIQGPQGFAIAEVDEAFTAEEMMDMGFLDRPEPKIQMDMSIWGGIFTSEQEMLPA